MLITDAGPIEETQQYGQGRVIGIQANAGIDITFANRFAVKIEGDYAPGRLRVRRQRAADGRARR